MSFDWCTCETPSPENVTDGKLPVCADCGVPIEPGRYAVIMYVTRQESNCQTGGDRPEHEIQITPEMKRAGGDVLLSQRGALDLIDDPDEIVAAIFYAMYEAAQKSPSSAETQQAK